MMKRYAQRLPLGQVTKQGAEYSRQRDDEMNAAIAKFNEGLKALGAPVQLEAVFFDHGNQLGIAVTWEQPNAD